MNYHNSKLAAETRSTFLRHEAEQHHLAQLACDGGDPLLAFEVEINVGHLAHWRLKWGTLRNIKVKPEYDTLLNCG